VPAARDLLLLGYNVIMSDIDVMWLKDPLPYLNTQAAQVKPAGILPLLSIAMIVHHCTANVILYRKY